MKKYELFFALPQRVTKTHSVTSFEPPGHLSLAECVYKHGYTVNCFSGDMYQAYSLIQKTIKTTSRTVVVGIYCDFENQSAVENLSKHIKETTSSIVVIGGPQTVGLGDDFLKKSLADALLRGEGEYSLIAFLDNLELDSWNKIENISGICMIKKDGSIVDNGIYPPIANLDKLPVVSGRKFYINSQYPNNISIITGRGCPYHCAFCYEGENGKTVRRRSVKHVINEIHSRILHNPYIRYLCFGDDTFTLDKQRVEDFCYELKTLRTEYDFVWFCDAHVHFILKYPEMIKTMIEAGLVRMQIGIESCNQSIIDIYNKNIKKEDLLRVVEICKEAGLPQLVGNIIIGGALETPSTLAETFDTVHKMYSIGGTMIEVVSTFYTPFPMTAMSREPSRFKINVCDWKGITSQGDYPMVSTPSLTLNQISTFRDDFFNDINSLMNEMYVQGQLSDDDILAMYKFSKYGLRGMWEQFAFSKYPLRHAQYQARARGNLLLSELSESVLNARPIRVFMLSLQPSILKSPPNWNGFVPSPFDMEILRLSAGKLTLGQIADEIEKCFGTHFNSREEMIETMKESLHNMEKHGLCTLEPPILPIGEKILTPNQNRKVVLIFRPYSMSTELTDDYDFCVPYSLFSLAAYIDEAGYDAYVCECRANDVAAYCKKFEPANLLAIGFSIDFENKFATLQLCRAVKDGYGLPVFIGGVEAAALNENEIKQSGVDAVMVGEGEISFVCLLDAVKNNISFNNISGLKFIDDSGNLVDTGSAKIIENLDTLPFPNYNKSLSTLHFDKVYCMTGRGCPYACSFCHESTYKHKNRRRSVANVIAEVKLLLSKHPEVRMLYFCDDTFVTDKNWVLEFCKEISQIRKSYNFSWYCEADVAALSVHPEIFPELAKSGLVRIQIGIESGDPEMLHLYHKPINPQKVEQVVKAAFDAGIPQIFGVILVGGPFENRQHIEINKEFMEKLMRLAPGVLEISASILMPYPLTDIGRYPERYGLTMSDPTGCRSINDYPLMHSETMSELEIVAAYQEYLLHSASVIKKMLEDGTLDHNRILQCYRYSQNGFSPYWDRMLSHIKPELKNYYTILSRGAAKRVIDIPQTDIPKWRPQRLIEIWRDIDFRQGWPILWGQTLAPIEFDILRYSTGKTTIMEVAEKLYTIYGKPFEEDFQSFLLRVIDILKEYDRNYQLLVVPY